MDLLKDIFGTAEEIGPFVFALRSIAVGVLLFLEGKILPHRSGGQFAGYDFAFFWMMGGITASPLFEAKISFINTAVIIVVIYILHYLISYIAVKNRTFAKVVMGKAIPLVLGGKIFRPNMAKAFFPLELLLSDMRNIDAPNISEVEAVVLETSGHVSVLKKSDHQPVTPKDLNIQTMGSGLPTLLINEGKIEEKNLKELGYDEKWLKDELLKKGISNIKDVYAALIDVSGELYYSVITEK
ncbi:MAG: YetF domain-containing protein [Vulcanibacillus sp.]